MKTTKYHKLCSYLNSLLVTYLIRFSSCYIFYVQERTASHEYLHLKFIRYISEYISTQNNNKNIKECKIKLETQGKIF